MSGLGVIHVGFSLIAILSGAIVLFSEKGTRFHKRMGWVYAAAMVCLNATALMIYRLFGHFGPFHVLALFSLATLAAGIVPVALRRPRDRWIERHYSFITGSYIGLIAALAAEITVRVPAIRPGSGAAFAALVIGSSAIVGLGGGLLSARGKRTTLARFVNRGRAQAS